MEDKNKVSFRTEQELKMLKRAMRGKDSLVALRARDRVRAARMQREVLEAAASWDTESACLLALKQLAGDEVSTGGMLWADFARGLEEGSEG